ncbi:MAG: PPK2 family polyphosphate kinase [Candidatus Nitrosocosmicus sp.]
MDYLKDLQVVANTQIKLSNWDPDFTGGISKNYAEDLFNKEMENQMPVLQYKLFADKSKALLIIFQGMDASGKDSTIRHVMNRFNPQSCKVVSFRKPNEEEIAHDYLWRIHKHIPAKGEITVFNRSHYEDVLTARVYDLVSEVIWTKRYTQINDFEKYLFENNVKIIKFFLHISKNEQKKKLQSRINDPTKRWKFSESDLIGHRLWDQYAQAYEDVLNKCSTKNIPWYIIPSNNKWFRNLAVAQIIIDTLKDMKLEFPKVKIDLSKILDDLTK